MTFHFRTVDKVEEEKVAAEMEEEKEEERAVGAKEVAVKVEVKV